LEFVPLTRLWGANGAAAVTFGSLVDAGFHPVVEYDLLGPMHFWHWPLGSQAPLVIWVHPSELEEARAFMDAPFEHDWPDEAERAPGFWDAMHRNRAYCYAGWFAIVFLSGAY